MSALSSLLVAIDLATRQRDAARQVLLDTQAARQGAQAQLDQLLGYAQETEQRWGVREQSTLQPEVFYHHTHFMGRLEHAANLQGGAVAEHDARVAQAREQLLHAELRLASLQKVVEHRRQALDMQQQRREQKQTDERAALQLRRVVGDPQGQE